MQLSLDESCPGLFSDPRIHLVIFGLDALANEAPPAEIAFLGPHVAERRRREFAAGRICAQRAMKSLGGAAHLVGLAEDRSPIWPAGIVGSISHSTELAAAAVASHCSGIVSIGLDIEPAEPFRSDLVEEVFTGSEQAYLARRVASERLGLATAIFCAKEAAYKCQYPLSRQIIGFHDLEIAFDPSGCAFSAKFLIDVLPFRAGSKFHGTIRQDANHFVSLVIL